MADNGGANDFITKVHLVIKQHAASTPPPFSDAVIIAMILLVTATAPASAITLKELLLARSHHFVYFAIPSIPPHPRSGRGYAPLEFDYMPLAVSFAAALHAYELPVQLLHSGGGIHARPIKYFMSVSEGACFLRSQAPKFFPSGVDPTVHPYFRFLDLPPELRNRIYELVIHFPDSGVRVAGRQWVAYGNLPKSQTWMTLVTREPTERVDGARWQEHLTSHTLTVEPLLTSVFDPKKGPPLMGVNRQLRKESSSIFWGQNRFHFVNLRELDHFLEKTHPKSLEQLHHVSFAHYDSRRTDANMTIRELVLKKTNVKRLTVWVEGSKWDSHKHMDGSLIYPETKDYPGMKLLANWDQLERVDLEGNEYTRAAVYLKAAGKKVFVDGKEQ